MHRVSAGARHSGWLLIVARVAMVLCALGGLVACNSAPKIPDQWKPPLVVQGGDASAIAGTYDGQGRAIVHDHGDPREEPVSLGSYLGVHNILRGVEGYGIKGSKLADGYGLFSLGGSALQGEAALEGAIVAITLESIDADTLKAIAYRALGQGRVETFFDYKIVDGWVVLSRKTGGEFGIGGAGGSGGAIVTPYYASTRKTLLLRKAADGALIVRETDREFDLILIIPASDAVYQLARFAPAPVPQLDARLAAGRPHPLAPPQTARVTSFKPPAYPDGWQGEPLTASSDARKKLAWRYQALGQTSSGNGRPGIQFINEVLAEFVQFQPHGQSQSSKAVPRTPQMRLRFEGARLCLTAPTADAPVEPAACFTATSEADGWVRLRPAAAQGPAEQDLSRLWLRRLGNGILAGYFERAVEYTQDNGWFQKDSIELRRSTHWLRFEGVMAAPKAAQKPP